VMSYYDQVELMRLLDGLNYRELKMIAGCGIPGDAWRYSLDLLRKKRVELDLLIEAHGQKATMTVESDDIEGVDPDGKTGIQTS